MVPYPISEHSIEWRPPGGFTPDLSNRLRLFTPNKSGQRLHPTYHRAALARSCAGAACSAGTVTIVPAEGVYNSESLRPPARRCLRQAFAHCARFATAASRRSLGRVSVPGRIVLSDQLPVDALVSRYLTNKLIASRSDKSFPYQIMRVRIGVSGISTGFPVLSQSSGAGCSRVTHPFATRSSSVLLPNGARFDLHVLSTPPAFVLSQGSNSPSSRWSNPKSGPQPAKIEESPSSDSNCRNRRPMHPDRVSEPALLRY